MNDHSARKLQTVSVIPGALAGCLFGYLIALGINSEAQPAFELSSGDSSRDLLVSPMQYAAILAVVGSLSGLLLTTSRLKWTGSVWTAPLSRLQVLVLVLVGLMCLLLGGPEAVQKFVYYVVRPLRGF
jgi:hypothetical protein